MGVESFLFPAVRGGLELRPPLHVLKVGLRAAGMKAGLSSRIASSVLVWRCEVDLVKCGPVFQEKELG